MIYEVYILFGKNKVQLYHHALEKLPIDNPKLVSGFLIALTNFATEIGENVIESLTFKTLKFVYSYFKDVFVTFVVDKEDEEALIKDKIRSVGEAFLLKYKPMLDEWDGDESVFDDFTDILKSVIKSILKIVLLGAPGVGKTTISKLLKGETIPVEHIPTIGATISEYLVSDEFELVVWDLAGQEQFTPIWKEFMSGAEVVFLVSDSSLENINETKMIYENNKEKVDSNCAFYAIANKQDLENSRSPSEVEEIIGIKSFGLVAIDPESRERLQLLLKSVIQEKIGIKLIRIEKEIIDGREGISELLEEIKSFKSQLIRLLNDYSNPIFRSINYWIDKFDFYPFEEITHEDGEKFKKEMQGWKEKAKELVSNIVKVDSEFNCPWCNHPITSKTEIKCPNCQKNFRKCTLCESIIKKEEDYSQCYYCKDIFHKECIQKYVNYRKKCPSCKKELNIQYDLIPKSRVKNF